MRTSRRGIVAKDGPALRELFVENGASWPAVAHTPRPNHVRALDTPDTFIEFIVASPDQLKETVRNLQVVTDGEVASVSFDYEFVSNSKVVNRGLECWQLVRSETGWKIAFIAYSIHAP